MKKLSILLSILLALLLVFEGCKEEEETPAPQITGISVDEVDLVPGQVATITVTGSGFGSDASVVQVKINGVTLPIQSITDSRIEVSIPDNATSGPISVTVNGQTVTGPTLAINQAPDLSTFSPASGPIGSEVTISGSNFPDDASEVEVEFFDGVFATIKSISENQIVVEVPDGAMTGKIKLTVKGVLITSANDFEVINQEPTADAGGDQEAELGKVVNLSAENSSDPEGDELTYAWSMISQPAGTEVQLENTNQEQLNFVPDMIGDYVVELMVSDGEGENTTQITISTTMLKDELNLWLMASEGVEKTDDDLVSEWKDLSENEHHFSVMDDANLRPTYKASGINDLPVLVFNDEHRLIRDDILGMRNDDPRTIIAVAKLGDLDDRGIYFGQGDIEDGDSWFNLEVNTWKAMPNRFSVYLSCGPVETDLETNKESNIQTLILPEINCDQVRNELEYYYDGEKYETQLTQRGKGLPFDGNTSVVGSGLIGEIAEVIVFGKAIDEQERKSIENYLGKKYNIALDGY